MIPPSVEDVDRYCRRLDYRFVDPAAFVRFHSGRNWKIRGRPMRSWKKAIVTWQKKAEADRPVELTMGRRAEAEPMPPLLAQILRLSWTEGKGWPYNK